MAFDIKYLNYSKDLVKYEVFIKSKDYRYLIEKGNPHNEYYLYYLILTLLSKYTKYLYIYYLIRFYVIYILSS